MNGLFYTLRWKGNDFRSDEHLAASENTVRIGQREDCEVCIPNNGRYADELFAVIKPTKSADGWQIISTSDYVKTYVNGSPVTLNHYLKGGDHISFGETSAEILFEIRKGENAGTSHFRSMSRRFIALVAGTAAIVIALALYGILAPNIVKNRNLAVLKAAEQSVVQLSVDSIYYVRNVRGEQDTLRREGQSIIGTAFLTPEGYLVTARHCIEPWLNFILFNSGSNLRDLPLGTAWAMEAETYNQTHRNDTSYHIVSKCSVHGPDGYWGAFRSSDFNYDNSRDEIIEFGNYSQVFFIRSITGRFNRSDMMLGDLAVMTFPSRKGKVLIPSEDMMKNAVVSKTVLTLMGYPKRLEDGIETTDGKVLKDYVPGHMISHNGGLDPGYSGGPALVVYDGKAYAVGVISTFDKDSQHCIYSVPASEIKNILAL